MSYSDMSGKAAEVICFTDRGYALALRVCGILKSEGFDANAMRSGKVTAAQWTSDSFQNAQLLVYIGAAGIAVRSIAPHIRSKTKDPAVIVIDEPGKFVIPVLSGHIGGANAAAQMLASKLGAQAVITTATDTRAVFAVDTWACSHGLSIINPERIQSVSSKVLDGKPVYIKDMLGIGAEPPAGVCLSDEVRDILIDIYRHDDKMPLILVPKRLVLGLGCRRGTAKQTIEAGYAQFMEHAGIYKEAVHKVCSIDLKENEPGLLDFCKSEGLGFSCFDAASLESISGEFSSSAFVLGITGVSNVCERSAVLGSGGKLIVKRHVFCGVTFALAQGC